MDLIKKSIKILKDLQTEKGGILATYEDGTYPYVYPRDAVVVTKAFNVLGCWKRAERFYYFMNQFAKIENHREIFHRYDKFGRPFVTRKCEHDCTGLVLHGIYNTYEHSKNYDFLEDLWPYVQKCVALIIRESKTGLVYTERSIHEFFRLEHGYEIWANCACCRGLYDAAAIAKILKYEKEARKWNLKAKFLENNIKKKLFNKKSGVFIKNLRLPHVSDISQLAPFYFNLIPSHVILRKTLNCLKKQLWHKELGGFRRFKRFEVCRDWHWYTGGSGSWTTFTIWAAKFYRELKDKKNYEECLTWINDVTDGSRGLLPEHIATKYEYDIWKENEIEFSGRVVKGMKIAEKMHFRFRNMKNVMYWAVPLAWPHAEYTLLKKLE